MTQAAHLGAVFWLVGWFIMIYASRNWGMTGWKRARAVALLLPFWWYIAIFAVVRRDSL